MLITGSLVDKGVEGFTTNLSFNSLRVSMEFPTLVTTGGWTQIDWSLRPTIIPNILLNEIEDVH